MNLKSRLIFQNICVLLGTLSVTVCLSLLFAAVYSDINDEAILTNASRVYGAVISGGDILANNSPLNEIQVREAVISAETGDFIYSTPERIYTVSLSAYTAHDGSMCEILTVVPAPRLKGFYGSLLAFVIITFILTFVIANFIAMRYNTAHIINPISELKQKTDRLAAGDLDCEISDEGVADIRLLCESVEQLRIKLKESLHYNRKSDENRRFLISSISHDLRTPITAVTGYIEGILDNVAATEEKRHEYLQKALSRMQQINSMINDLLLYSKLDLDQLPFEFAPTAICEYIKFIAEDNSFGGGRKINVIPETDERYVRLDGERFSRVMQNIFDNAKRHSDGEINVYLRETVSSVIIETADSGEGISPDLLPHIFEKFYRGDTSRKSDGSGGLGLAIAKLIVEKHGGQIWASGNSAKGLSIIISLKKMK